MRREDAEMGTHTSVLHFRTKPFINTRFTGDSCAVAMTIYIAVARSIVSACIHSLLLGAFSHGYVHRYGEWAEGNLSEIVSRVAPRHFIALHYLARGQWRTEAWRLAFLILLMKVGMIGSSVRS